SEAAPAAALADFPERERPPFSAALAALAALAPPSAAPPSTAPSSAPFPDVAVAFSAFSSLAFSALSSLALSASAEEPFLPFFLRPEADWPPEPLPSTGSAETIRPRPLQCSQLCENASSRPWPTRLRVICTSPSEVTSATWCLVRSRERHSSRR